MNSSNIAVACEHEELYGKDRQATIDWYRNRWFRQKYAGPTLAVIKRVQLTPPPAPRSPQLFLIKKAA